MHYGVNKTKTVWKEFSNCCQNLEIISRKTIFSVWFREIFAVLRIFCSQEVVTQRDGRTASQTDTRRKQSAAAAEKSCENKTCKANYTSRKKWHSAIRSSFTETLQPLKPTRLLLRFWLWSPRKLTTMSHCFERALS